MWVRGSRYISTEKKPSRVQEVALLCFSFVLFIKPRNPLGRLFCGIWKRDSTLSATLAWLSHDKLVEEGIRGAGLLVSEFWSSGGVDWGTLCEWRIQLHFSRKEIELCFGGFTSYRLLLLDNCGVALVVSSSGNLFGRLTFLLLEQEVQRSLTEPPVSLAHEIPRIGGPRRVRFGGLTPGVKLLRHLE